MNEIKDGGPAFPGEESTDFIVKCQCGEMVTFNDVYHPGMTLRDWFAGQALAGINASDLTLKSLATINDGTTLAECAYAQADAMLKERERP